MLARGTPGFSGCRLANLVNEAEFARGPRRQSACPHADSIRQRTRCDGAPERRSDGDDREEKTAPDPTTRRATKLVAYATCEELIRCTTGDDHPARPGAGGHQPAAEARSLEPTPSRVPRIAPALMSAPHDEEIISDRGDVRPGGERHSRVAPQDCARHDHRLRHAPRSWASALTGERAGRFLGHARDPDPERLGGHRTADGHGSPPLTEEGRRQGRQIPTGPWKTST